jgi:lysozyme family protein
VADGHPKGLSRLSYLNLNINNTHNQESIMQTKYKFSDQFVSTVIGTAIYIEGGISDDPRDRGRLTKYGISTRYYPEALNPNFGVEDAVKIYTDIAIKAKVPEIIQATGSYELGAAILTNAINPDLRRAALLLQGFLVNIGYPVKIDGVIGPQTIEAVSVGFQTHPDFVLRYRDTMVGWWIGHAVSSQQMHYIKGWIRRMGQAFTEASGPEGQESISVVMATRSNDATSLTG